MQDLHSLRRKRQTVVEALVAAQRREKNVDVDVVGKAPSIVEASLRAMPNATDADLCRELGSVLRCDLSLVCSPAEASLLARTFGVAPAKLQLAPFFVEPEALMGPPLARNGEASSRGDFAASALVPRAATEVNFPAVRLGFGDRRGFMTIGTFRHAPNVDGLRWLAAEVRVKWSETDQIKK
jgi:hypothetical protein